MAIALIGFGIWWLTRSVGYTFQRADLDRYVEATSSSNTLGDGASVYVDMSDGMNYAYATPQSQAMLQAIINKLAANQAIKFYGLADRKITPLDYSHTELYNYMLNQDSYSQQMAPIENTLQQIVDKKQPALLMSDFEEYKGSIIEKAAYAKQYFIDWLAMGFNINFYKWDFEEKGKQKHMFLAVFDDNANRLNSLVASAVRMTDPGIATFVLGSHDFAYPIFTMYPSLKQGGNYHDSKGKDNVTAVMEAGGIEDFVCYAKPLASASGTQGLYAPLDVSYGTLAEYYPIGVDWKSAIENSGRMKEDGVPTEEQFSHLLSNLYVDFGAQNGYSIQGIEVRVFDMQSTMKAVNEEILQGNALSIKDLEAIDKPEVNMVLTAGMENTKTLPAGWKEIYVDFDEKFNGSFMGGFDSSDLLRANIVIAKSTPEIGLAATFFGWEGNPSLANSVKETLTASTSSPVGRVLYTYYIKSISK